MIKQTTALDQKIIIIKKINRRRKMGVGGDHIYVNEIIVCFMFLLLLFLCFII